MSWEVKTCPPCPKLSSPLPWQPGPCPCRLGSGSAAPSLLLGSGLLWRSRGHQFMDGGAGGTYTPLGPGGLQTRGLVGQTAQSCLQRKSVSFSLLNANLSAGGICLQSPFLCSSPGKLSRFQGGVLRNQLLPPSVPPEGGGNAVISWDPRLSKLFQAGPRRGRRGPRVQDALPSPVHQTQTL